MNNNKDCRVGQLTSIYQYIDFEVQGIALFYLGPVTLSTLQGQIGIQTSSLFTFLNSNLFTPPQTHRSNWTRVMVKGSFCKMSSYWKPKRSFLILIIIVSVRVYVNRLVRSVRALVLTEHRSSRWPDSERSCPGPPLSQRRNYVSHTFEALCWSTL